MKVHNKKCIRQLSLQNMKGARGRSLVAIVAIVLTTVLFTTLFTVALSINHSIQQANFRQAGGWSHASLKYLTQEQFEQIKTDPLIRQYGLRRFVGMAEGEAFLKSHVEVGYSDAAHAHWMYCDPVQGQLPAEGTNEAATDTRVLELLGVEPVVGNQFTLSMDVDGKTVTESFVLSGWWNYDEAIVANHVLLPHSRAQAIFEQVGIGSDIGTDGMTASWNMDMMLRSSLHIEDDVQKILQNYGYQNESPALEGGYIATGVNWGYTGAQLIGNADPTTLVGIAGLLLIMIFTGYLIIYNVFQISVSTDIRFYGLLKTIGTTGKQLKRIVGQQALVLSAIGIPVGLLIGYVVGVWLTPVILLQLNGVVQDEVSASPLIFIGSALFSLFTVNLSCRKPRKLAAKVSPIEAVRFAEGSVSKKSQRRARTGASLPKMAWANLGRSRGKTAITIASLSLAVVLLQMTVAFANGFDMDKYLAKMAADFMVADAGYFKVGNFWSAEKALPEDALAMLESQASTESGGRVYGQSSSVEEFIPEAYYRQRYSRWNDEETLNHIVDAAEKNKDGLLSERVQLYGMEDFVLGKLNLVEGDLAKLQQLDGRYIAAVYLDDDYGSPKKESHWAKLGDLITLRYVEEYEYYDPETGKVLDPDKIPDYQAFRQRAKVFREIDYEVAALVTVPHSLSYRYYSTDAFVINSDTFVQDSGTRNVMYYAYDTHPQSTEEMETLLSDYTTKQQPQLGYESKSTYAKEFYAFRSMFLLLGTVLSLIVGLVGVLNFLNVILSGILARRRELAMLGAIGMSGKQLKAMLIWEGLFYTFGAVAVSLLLSLAAGPLLSGALESIFWFFTYRFTAAPLLIITPIFAALGITVPLVVYHVVAKRSVVERLRERE